MRERTSPLANLVAALVIAALVSLFAYRSFQRHTARSAERLVQRERTQLAELEDRRRRAAWRKAHAVPVFRLPENLKHQGPVLVETVVDGGEDPNGAWDSPDEFASDDKTAAKFAVAGLAPQLETNALKCRFPAGAFSVPRGSAPRGVVIRFRAYSSGGMGDPIVRVKSVRTTLGSTNLADHACLTAADSLYTYGSPTDGIDLSVDAGKVNVAWEIELVFDAPNSADFGNAHVHSVSSTVYYGAATSPSASAGGIDIHARSAASPPRSGETRSAIGADGRLTFAVIGNGNQRFSLGRALRPARRAR